MPTGNALVEDRCQVDGLATGHVKGSNATFRLRPFAKILRPRWSRRFPPFRGLQQRFQADPGRIGSRLTAERTPSPLSLPYFYVSIEFSTSIIIIKEMDGKRGWKYLHQGWSRLTWANYVEGIWNGERIGHHQGANTVNRDRRRRRVTAPGGTREPGRADQMPGRCGSKIPSSFA